MISNRQKKGIHYFLKGFIPLNNSKQNRRIFLTGFTLLEILISISILLIVTSMVYAIFRNSLNYWVRGYSSSRRQQSARLAFSRMTSNISSLFISTARDIYCLGAKDKFYFIVISTSDDQGGLSEIGYEFNLINKTLVFSYQNKADYDFDTYDDKNVIATSVENLTFSYLDENGNWLENWDSRQGAKQQGISPQAVKIYFEVENNDLVDKKEVFETIVELPIRTKYQ